MKKLRALVSFRNRIVSDKNIPRQTNTPHLLAHLEHESRCDVGAHREADADETRLRILLGQVRHHRRQLLRAA